jgi:probable rRNA maturation factor
MLDVEVFGAELAPGAPSPQEVQRLCALATMAVGVEDGHLAIEYVDERRIAQLNAEHRGKDGPTDVLSFPIDGAPQHESLPPRDPLREGAATSDGIDPSVVDPSVVDPSVVDPSVAGHSDDSGRSGGVERELGDVVICPAHTSDLREAIVHGVLHLVGFDHETDDGEMLALQAQLLAGEAR